MRLLKAFAAIFIIISLIWLIKLAQQPSQTPQTAWSEQFSYAQKYQPINLDQRLFSLSEQLHFINSRQGFTTYISLNDQDIKQAADYGANTLRLMIMLDDLYTDYELDKAKIQKIKDFINMAQAHNLTVILDVHEVPGLVRWSQNKDFALWKSKNNQYTQKLKQTWQVLAQKFANYPEQAIIYQLLNEPGPINQSWKIQEKKADYWLDLQDQIIQDIRIIDKKHTIIASPAWAWLAQTLNEWQPSDTILKDGRIAVAVHMYAPHEYTHQLTAWDNKEPVKAYPSVQANNISWDKLTLYDSLSAIKDFKDKYTTLPIIVTEFSAIRIAPGADLWLRDVISIFNNYDLGWIYHTYREETYYPEASMWNLEHGEPNRLEVIKQAMEQKSGTKKPIQTKKE